MHTPYSSFTRPNLQPNTIATTAPFVIIGSYKQGSWPVRYMTLHCMVMDLFLSVIPQKMPFVRGLSCTAENWNYPEGIIHSCPYTVTNIQSFDSLPTNKCLRMGLISYSQAPQTKQYGQAYLATSYILQYMLSQTTALGAAHSNMNSTNTTTPFALDSLLFLDSSQLSNYWTETILVKEIEDTHNWIYIVVRPTSGVLHTEPTAKIVWITHVPSSPIQSVSKLPFA